MEREKYQVIYADPPWFYNNRKTGGERKDKTKFGGGARKHYPLMSDEALVRLRPMIDKIADENSALFMWATMPRMDFAVRLIEDWGFRFVTTAFVWVKPALSFTGGGSPRWNNGPGYYTASNSEIVILAVRGKMKPEKKMIDSVIFKPRGRHSAKPSVARERIELMYPTARKIELFARERVIGWEAWGNQV